MHTKAEFARFSGAIAVAVLAANMANAATIDFGSGSGDDPYIEDGFSFNESRLVNGNCDPAGPCLALNDNETTVMTFSDGAFDLQSVHFTLLGNGTSNTLTVFETGNILNAISFSVPAYAHNAYYTELFGSTFSGVSSITFATNGGGNVRIDGLEAVGQVPLPGTLGLLGLGLAGLGAVRRKKAA